MSIPASQLKGTSWTARSKSSGPWIAASTRAQSSTPRHMGPILPRVCKGRFQITHAQLPDVDPGVPIERNILDGEIQVVRSLDRGQHKSAVFDAAAHGTDFIETPTQRHGAVAADAPERGPQSRYPADTRGLHDRSQGFRADGETNESGGSR